MDVDRLAEIAVELAHRVRTSDTPANAAWLAKVLGPSDMHGLVFIQAAANPPTRERFARAIAWASSPNDIDEIAVERACHGEDVPLNSAERRRVVETLARAGRLTDQEIGVRAGLNRRSVQRIRAKIGVRRRM